MSQCRGIWTWAALVALLASGCEAPKMMPVAPPGLEYTNETPDKPEDAAEAIGETRGGASAPTNLAPAPPPAEPTKPGELKTLASGVKYETLKEGTGAVAAWGKTAVVHYVGNLTTGEKFDSSRDRKKPFDVTLGRQQVIPGWEIGLQGMRVGETRKLVIPPELAYKDQAPKGSIIPPNATLVFEVELLDVR